MWARVSECDDVGFIREKPLNCASIRCSLDGAGQKQMTTIEEELPVLDRLEKRLTGVLSKDELRRGWVVGARPPTRSLGCQSIAARRFRSDDPRLEGDQSIWSALVPGTVLARFGEWRLFIPDRDKLFDMKASCLTV